MIRALRRVLGGHAVGGELGVTAWGVSAQPSPAKGPLWVTLSAGQPHPIDLRWVDTLVASARPHLMVRPEDDLLILVPNTPLKLNRTAVRLLHAMVHDGLGIADVLAREGDSPRRRVSVHEFFTDLAAWLEGRLGEGHGRRAVVREPFTAGFLPVPRAGRGRAHVPLQPDVRLLLRGLRHGRAARRLERGPRDERRRGLPRPRRRPA